MRKQTRNLTLNSVFPTPTGMKADGTPYNQDFVLGYFTQPKVGSGILSDTLGGGGEKHMLQSVNKDTLVAWIDDDNITRETLDDDAFYSHKSGSGKACNHVKINLSEAYESDTMGIAQVEIVQSEYEELSPEEQKNFSPKQYQDEDDNIQLLSKDGEQIWRSQFLSDDYAAESTDRIKHNETTVSTVEAEISAK